MRKLNWYSRLKNNNSDRRDFLDFHKLKDTIFIGIPLHLQKQQIRTGFINRDESQNNCKAKTLHF